MTKEEQRPARIFYPNTRFERMARRSGGMSRAVALKQAQEQIDGCKDSFAAWLDQQLQDLQAAAAELARDQSNETAVARADRICADIGDLGTTMGYELLTFAARSCCSVLGAFRAGANLDSEILDCHVKALLLAGDSRYRDLGADQTAEMVNGLLRIASLVQKTVDT